jgi:chemosensory pili system protein ChpA (sensor histidine kinase/response regulator)
MKRMTRILVVDDDVASREAATAILHELGCAVETRADGDTALDRLRHVVPDALLVGLNIPEMAGGAFVQACHQDPRCSEVPVVVMAVTPRAAVDAIRVGARGCIRKPVDTGGLVMALQPLLGMRSLCSDSRAIPTATAGSPSATNPISPSA